MELLCERAARLGKDTLSVGWSGGHSTSLVAKRLAGLLGEPRVGLPKKIVFHSLTAGFDVQTIVTDPNGFLSYIVGSPSVRREDGVRRPAAPAIVKINQRDEMLALPGIKDAYELARNLDLVVTAAGVLDDPHSMLHLYYDNYSPETAQFLDAQPLRGRHPLVAAADDDAGVAGRGAGGGPQPALLGTAAPRSAQGMHELVKGGSAVLLVLGPCTYCSRNKSRVSRGDPEAERRVFRDAPRG